MSDLVHRLRLIVAEPAAWCKTDVEYVEDAADEIELLRSTVTDCRIEIARLTAERDEARREYCFAFAELTTEPTWEPPTHEQAAKLVANKRGWSCFKEDGK
jgi:hypothetical protein